MRLTAIVVLGLSFAVAACNQPPSSKTGGAAAGSGAAAEAAEAAAGSGAAAVEPASGSASASRAAAAAASEPAFREVTIPEGTTLSLVLDTAVASDRSKVEDPVRAHLARTVTVAGLPALPTGSTVEGIVTDAQRSGKVKGVAQLGMAFHRVTRKGDTESYRIETTSAERVAHSTKKKDATKIGIGAAGGALIGAIAGGGKGAAIGSAVGAGAGGAVVMSTRGDEVRLGKGATVTVKLAEPLIVKVPRG